MMRGIAPLLASLSVLLFVPYAEGCVNSNGQLPTAADSIYFYSNDPLPTWATSAIDGGITMWSGCGGTPNMYRGTSGDIPVRVQYSLFSDFGCAEVQRYLTSSGGLNNAVLNLYEYDVNGNSCSSHGSGTLAHEMGHLLGLAHSQCSGYIMSYDTNRSVQPDECDFADQSFSTTEETREITSDSTNCDLRLADDCDSPVVVDLDGRGFSFTSWQDGVLFDLDADGTFEKVAWTVPGGDEAFLALDRNGNGRIDDGKELFGNRTDQPASDSPNGFIALALLDAPESGGNGDGWISRDDHLFGALVLWQDADHDGWTDPGELIAVDDLGLERISLDYRWSGRRDRHGNLLRYHSRVFFDGDPYGKSTVDVFLRLYDPLR